MRRAMPFVITAFTLASACGPRGGSSMACGLATMTGPLLVLESFGRGNALAVAPDSIPQSLPVRLVAGPVLRGIVGRSDSTSWVVGAEGDVPPETRAGFGVLIVHAGEPRGVLVFEGQRVAGAAVIGAVAVGDTTVPLIGTRIDPATIADRSCPVFPDSAR